MKTLNIIRCIALVFVAMLVTFVLLVLIAYPATAEAGELGPWRTSSTLTTNAFTISIPIGETGRFQPQHLLFISDNSSASYTVTVTRVIAGITNSVGAKACTATDSLYSVTNQPWMFYGDYFRGVISGASTVTAYSIGNVWD